MSSQRSLPRPTASPSKTIVSHGYGEVICIHALANLIVTDVAAVCSKCSYDGGLLSLDGMDEALGRATVRNARSIVK